MKNRKKKKKELKIIISERSEMRHHPQPAAFRTARGLGLFGQRQTERSVVKHLRNSALWLRKSVSLCFVSIAKRRGGREGGGRDLGGGGGGEQHLVHAELISASQGCWISGKKYIYKIIPI